MNIYHPSVRGSLCRILHDDLIDQIIEIEIEIAEHSLQRTWGIWVSPDLRHLWLKRIGRAILREASREVYQSMPSHDGFRRVIRSTLDQLCLEARATQKHTPPLPCRFVQACVLFCRCIVLSEGCPNAR